mmetsp:Transcript_13281/g.28797  ORF Transcript_13281/g.28797 Transcript_13281/m.28797 type:complete len:229 (-) Transcript_13281:1677-2363(-)
MMNLKLCSGGFIPGTSYPVANKGKCHGLTTIGCPFRAYSYKEGVLTIGGKIFALCYDCKGTLLGEELGDDYIYPDDEEGDRCAAGMNSMALMNRGHKDMFHQMTNDNDITIFSLMDVGIDYDHTKLTVEIQQIFDGGELVESWTDSKNNRGSPYMLSEGGQWHNLREKIVETCPVLWHVMQEIAKRSKGQVTNGILSYYFNEDQVKNDQLLSSDSMTTIPSRINQRWC